MADVRCSSLSKHTKPSTNMTLARNDFPSFEIVIRTCHGFVLHLSGRYVGGKKPIVLRSTQWDTLSCEIITTYIWFANRSFARSLGERRTCAIHLQNHLIEIRCNRFEQNGCKSNKCVGPAGLSFSLLAGQLSLRKQVQLLLFLLFVIIGTWN